MLLRHSAYYLLSRGGPSIINFLGVMLYTRLLEPAQFGRYALVIVIVTLVDSLVFQWVRLVLLRFLGANKGMPNQFLGEIIAIYLVLSIGLLFAAFIVSAVTSDTTVRMTLWLAAALLITQAIFQTSLTLAAAKLSPGVYARILGLKTIMAVSAGVLLAWAGLGEKAPILGLFLGQLFAILVFGGRLWNWSPPILPRVHNLKQYLAYGLPLAASFMLDWVISSSDRLFVSFYLGGSAVGLYSAGYDIAKQGVGVIVSVINTAALPLAMRALDTQGPSAAKTQLANNGILVVTAALSLAVALVVLSPQVAAIAVGSEFRAAAAMIMPWIACAAALSAIKAFHFDVAFQLSRSTSWQVYISASAAMLNLVLNSMLIPRVGLVGAAASTVIAYAVSMVLSAYFGRLVFGMPPIPHLLAKAIPVAAFTGVGAFVGSAIYDESTILSFFLGVAGALACSTISAVIVDIVGVRSHLQRLFHINRRVD